MGKYLQLCARAHYRATTQNLDSRTQLDEPVQCASGGDPFLLYKILHFLFFPQARILCALRLASRKKIISMVLMRDLWNFSFFVRGDVSQTIQNSVALFRGHRQNTRSHFLSASTIAIMSWQDVARSSLCSGVKDCGTKRAHNFLFPKSSFRIRRTTVLGMFKDSAIIIDAIRRSFFGHISNSSTVYLSSSRFWTATSLVIFYQLPSVSKSRIPHKNV